MIQAILLLIVLVVCYLVHLHRRIWFAFYQIFTRRRSNFWRRFVTKSWRFSLTCIERLATPNFSLWKFIWNSDNLRYDINNVTNKNNSTKILEIIWNIKRNTSEFNFQEHMLLIQDPSTNRSLVKYSTSLYDPLGLFNPYIVHLKVLFQKVCKVGISWDQFFFFFFFWESWSGYYYELQQ